MGLSMPPFLAGVLGNSPLALTAAGTTQATATLIRAHNIEMTATGADGIRMPVDAKTGTPYFIYNSSGSTGLVYVGSGDTLNSTLNGSLSLATHKAAIIWQYKEGFWASVLTA